MRLFVAVDLTASARIAIEALARELAGRVAEVAGARAARWVRPEKLHLTLAFLGAIEPDQVDAIRRGLEPPMMQPTFEVAMSGAGVFPGTGPVRVLWLGITAGRENLVSLQGQVASRLREVGCALERRPFVPHLTLARFRRPCRGRAAIAVRQLVSQAVVSVDPWRVDHVTLYESRLAASGPTYVPLARGCLAS